MQIERASTKTKSVGPLRREYEDMSNNIGRPQKPKVFEMEVEISTKVADVGAYTLEETHSGM